MALFILNKYPPCPPPPPRPPPPTLYLLLENDEKYSAMFKGHGNFSAYIFPFLVVTLVLLGTELSFKVNAVDPD